MKNPIPLIFPLLSLDSCQTDIPAATANCAFSKDEKTLYLTADNYLLR